MTQRDNPLLIKRLSRRPLDDLKHGTKMEVKELLPLLKTSVNTGLPNNLMEVEAISTTFVFY